ncbi:O-methyltransferase-domain-containing protein [Nemania sp. FL0916]|nr:O-methyltransferase-domain-containing protein [Nemania sp. FL0916]
MDGARATNGFHAEELNGIGHDVKKPTEELVGTSTDSRAVSHKMVELVIENLLASVQSALSYLQGPLKQPLHDLLHDQEKLPDVKLLGLARDAVDALFKAQQILEPKSLILADHFLGYINSKCLNAAVERNIPDILAKGPVTLESLCQESGSRPDRMGQVLRVLYNNGIFEYDEQTGLYSNNEASSLLRADHWTGWRNWVELYGNQFYDVARGIPESVQSQATRSAAQINYDTDTNMFEYFKQQGWIDILHRTLGAGATAMAPGILQDYPWADLASDPNTIIMDIGGGSGGLISSILREYKTMRGGIFDRPEVIEQARTSFHTNGGRYSDVGHQISPENLISGDFFVSIPPCEIYTMKWCLHDWKDEQAIKILRNIRKSIITGPRSRLIVMETVLADGRTQRLSRYGDIHMMMTANGGERTEAQWHSLASQSGWQIKAIYHLRNAWVKALEFRPVESQYEMGHDASEVNRLTIQHSWIKASMGTLVHCPIDPRKENMSILDSGTADGLWLEDMATTLPESTKYIGTDIADHLFPVSTKADITFYNQSITDPWPKEWRNSFDLVHQRLVLSACDPAAAKRAVSELFAMVKPGGWIQLLECDHSGGFTPEQAAIYPATKRFGDLVLKTMEASGKSGQYGKSLRSWLLEAGAVDVVETQMDCPVGARANTEDLKKHTKENMLSVVRNLKSATKDLDNFEFKAADFDTLSTDLERELSATGSTQRFHLVYGRRRKVN